MDLKDMTFDQLLAEQAGRTLMMLGEGTKMKSIVFATIEIALRWKAEQDKKEAKAFPLPEQEKALRLENARLKEELEGFYERDAGSSL